MKIPFSKEAFLEVFERYNMAVWPAQWFLLALAVSCVVVILWRRDFSVRFAFLILCAFWLWMGVAYHWIFFSTINPAALVFGGLFVVQAVAFFYSGFLLPVAPAPALAGWRRQAAFFVLAYALIIYPLWGYLAGHAFPAGPTFGVPCPTTVFTFGVLMLLPVRLPWWISAIPVLWSVVGLSAAISLSIPEDFGLTATAIIYVAAHVIKQLLAQAN